MEKFKKILVFRNGAIGNTLVSQGFFRTLKELYPRSELHLVVDAIGKEVLKYDPFIDKFFIFNRKKDSFSYQWNLVKEWKKEAYDISFHLRSGVRNELLAFFSKIPRRVGFPLKGTYQFLTDIVSNSGGHHHSDLGRILLSHFEPDVPNHLPRLFSHEEEEKKVSEKLDNLKIEKKNYVIIHPTGNTVKKDEWNLSFFNSVIEYISTELKLTCILIGSSEAEKQFVEKELNFSGEPVFWYGDNISIISELIRNAKFFCGNDSGPFHIAECWDIPSVVLYRDNPENYKKWRPLNLELSEPVFHSELKDHEALLNKLSLIFKRWI
jgi:ADP-heptose:LPS heptosyltransferase